MSGWFITVLHGQREEMYILYRDWWRSPVIAACLRSDLIDILRQGTQALTNGACMYACTIGLELLVKQSDPYLLWRLQERKFDINHLYHLEVGGRQFESRGIHAAE